MDKSTIAGLVLAAAHPRAEKFCVLDVKGYSTTRPYNIGYLIADRYGYIYLRRSFALPSCIWENVVAMISSRQAEEMTKANIEEILQDVEKKKTKRKYNHVSCETFKQTFKTDLQNFNVKKLYAYNVSFDKGALTRLFGATELQMLSLEFCDIISGIVQTRLQTKKYLEFCNEHGFITEKGNFMTKAEIVYKYLSGVLDFAEEHTGLADCEIEYQILLTALNSRKKINWKPCQAWRILKSYANEKEIDVKIPVVGEGA